MDRFFRKSSFSETQSACVEVAVGVAQVAVRDSKAVAGGIVVADSARFAVFLDAVKRGVFG